jgi:hypothetical protein
VTTRHICGLTLLASVAACGGGGGASSGNPDAGPPPPACGSQPFQPPTGGKTYYVAPGGSDSAAGTMAAPFRTMEKAANVANGGDVVYLRDGVYPPENFNAEGGAGSPVVFMAAPGEHPILDGAGMNLDTSDSVLQLFNPLHVVVAGLEIRNSGGRGVQIIDGEDVVIRDCTIHDVQIKALGLNGNNLVAESNVIYNAVLDNANSTAGGGWASAVTTQLLEDGSPSSNVTVRGNLIYDAWGECIDALFVDGMSIIGNEVRDCFSVGIYVDTARSVRVEGNIVRASNQAYQRNGHLMDGILLGSEAGDSSSPDFGADDVVIANNIVLGTHNGIAWWDDTDNTRASNTYQRVQVVGNVAWGSQQNAIMFEEVSSGRTAPNGAVLTDNILYGGSAVRIGDASAWTITANIFPDSVPSIASDPSNVKADPQLPAPAVDAPAEAFRPSTGSPARHAGRPVAAVPLDFACAQRGTSDTTIGAFE